MATFNSLAKNLTKKIDRLPERVNKLAKQTANDVLIEATMLRSTKVDTSKAVSNWRIGLGSRDDRVREPFYPGTRNSTGAASRAEARTVGKLRIAVKNPGQEIHITNNVDYLDVAFTGSVDGIISSARAKLQKRIGKFKF